MPLRLDLIETCLCLHSSRIRRFQPARIAAVNPVGKHNLVDQYTSVHLSSYQYYVPVCTAPNRSCTALYLLVPFLYRLVPFLYRSCTTLYLLVPFLYRLVPSCTVIVLPCTSCTVLVPPCTILYHLVPSCTILVQSCTYWYIPVRANIGLYKLVRTICTKKADSCMEITTSWVIPVHTVLYRFTGFQMKLRMELVKLSGCITGRLGCTWPITSYAIGGTATLAQRYSIMPASTAARTRPQG